ncbi:MAG: hypothetical protein E7666_01670 [Ruminococcaceae bacterium]|nr:hypothetical protein [Oscillospiraceae bacterium]
MPKIDLQYYPGWVRKVFTFTIDDGNIKLDKKFIDHVKPAGICGTFNLKTPLKQASPEEYRALYRGYEIANHCKYHAYAFTEETTREHKNEPFDRESADKRYLYPTAEEGLYRVYTYAWCYVATDEKYLSLVRECSEELEAVFGKGTIRDYVWPCGEQKNPTCVDRMVKEGGFRSLRKTGNIGAKIGYPLPSDRMHWSYTCNPLHDDLCAMAKAYEEYPDDGKLTWFCFGLHSHDYENANRWGMLAEFCDRFGNRPETFWSAAVGEIFDYEDAVKSVVVTDTEIVNPSEVDLYIKVHGKRMILGAKSSISIS